MEVLCLRSLTTSRSSKTTLEASSGVGGHTTIIDERLEFYSLFDAFFWCVCVLSYRRTHCYSLFVQVDVLREGMVK